MLEDRKAECQKQIDARQACIEFRARGPKWVGSPDGAKITGLWDDDTVVKNLRRRLESYEIDIVRMRQHDLASLEPTKSARVWMCACGATGNMPTAYTAMVAHGRHVEEAVWGS